MCALPFSFATVILAAGASSRMGRQKLLLPWGTSTVLNHLIEQWQSSGAAQVAVVCATVDVLINQELDRMKFPREQRIVNSDPARGMFSSIQCAARWAGWKKALTHWAIALGDQPHLANESICAVIACAAQNPDAICQPTLNGRPRHPVILPKNIFNSLTDSNHPTLKHFLEAHASRRNLVEVDDAGLDLDLDTPADYEEARKRYGL